MLLWSSGFIGSKLGLGYAEPFTFLFIRLLALAVLLTLAGWLSRAPWPRSGREVLHLVVCWLRWPTVSGQVWWRSLWACSRW